ncbi:11428_t:CDS:2, partial [Racocetra fulgida]
LKQRATVKKLVYKQDNAVRENFNAEILEKKDSFQDIEKEQPLLSIPKPRKRKVKNLSENKENKENKNFKKRLLEHQLKSEVEDSENEEYEDEDDVIDFSTVLFDQQAESSKVDLSSEFSGGMCSWFGEEWSELKAKALAQINIKPKKFEDAIESDINKIEEMFLTDPFIFVDKEGNKQNLTEIEFVLKVAGPIIDIIFSDVQHLVHLKW